MRWSLGRLGDVVVTYRHRGAPGDERAVEGGDIREVTRGWLVVRRGKGPPTQIPWHRILRIELDGHVLWERS